MDDTFQTLARFLDQFGEEVQGRETPEPPEETKTRLRQLARGDLPLPDRTELLAQLVSNTEWIAWLAREVKALRGTSS